MGKRTYNEKLHIDMSFGEALERFARTDAREVETNIKRAKTKKPPGGKKAKPSGGKGSKTVVQLRERRVRKRNTGR